MSANSFQDLELGTETVRGRSGEGGPLGGAQAAVRKAVPGARTLLSRLSSRARHAEGKPQPCLVIEAPTWRLQRAVEPGHEYAASDFADEVNSAAQRAATASWWPVAN